MSSKKWNHKIRDSNQHKQEHRIKYTNMEHETSVLVITYTNIMGWS